MATSHSISSTVSSALQHNDTSIEYYGNSHKYCQEIQANLERTGTQEEGTPQQNASHLSLDAFLFDYLSLYQQAHINYIYCQNYALKFLDTFLEVFQKFFFFWFVFLNMMANRPILRQSVSKLRIHLRRFLSIALNAHPEAITQVTSASMLQVTAMASMSSQKVLATWHRGFGNSAPGLSFQLPATKRYSFQYQSQAVSVGHL